MRRLLLASSLCIIAVAVAIAGCGSDRVVNPPTQQPRIYPDPINPYAALDALRLAYQRRDTAEIKLLYDDLYQGTSIDQADPSPTLLNFTKSDEVAHVSKLARTSGIYSVSLLPVFNMLRTSDPSDPPGWATITNPYSSLVLGDSLVAYTVDFTGELSEFKLAPYAPYPGSPTDTTWKIIRWTEVRP